MNFFLVMSFGCSYIWAINEQQHTMNAYATIKFNGSKTYTVVLSCGQCVFATQSKRKAENRLANILKAANEQ